MGYKAESVSVSDDAVIIEVSDVDINDVFSVMDIEGTIKAELSQVQAYDADVELSYIVGGTEEENYEDGQKYSLREAVVGEEVEAVEITKVYIIPDMVRQQYNIADGVNATITCKISDVWYDYKCSFTDAYACVGGTVSFDCNVSGDVLGAIGVPDKIELLRVPVWGNFIYMNATLDLTLKGDVTLSLVEDVEVGLEAGKDGCRLIKSFHKRSFTIQASVEASAGVTANAFLDLMALKGHLYAKIGARVKAVSELYDSDSPIQCTHVNAHMYASAGGSVKVSLLWYKKEWSKDVTIYDAQNSPVRLFFHYENGVPVEYCTKDLSSSETTSSGSAKYKYYTPVNSKYGYSGASKGTGANGQPYTIFDYKLNDEGNATVTGYYGNVSALSIPATLDGYKVVEIGQGVFRNNTQLRIVVIPDSVTNIGSKAFYGCVNLSSVSLSKGVTSIGYGAFENCDGLTSIEIPKSLKETAGGYKSNSGVFRGCDNLKTVTFEQGTTKVANYLFANCPGIERIEIPDGVTDIGRYAFYGCKNLKEVRLPSSVTELEHGAFEQCTSLAGITIPDSVTSIGAYAFYSCSNLAAITIPDSVTSIGNNAFYGCVNLSSVSLSKGVTSIGYGAFENCDGLTSIEIPKSLKETAGGYESDSGVFRGCDNLKTVTFEQGTTKVANYLFANCPGIERIEIPDGVTDIGRYAFYGCKNLKEVRLPSSVTELEHGAFEQCTSLAGITIPDSVTSIGNNAFDGCSSLTSAKLPQNITKIENYLFSNCSSLKTVDMGGAIQRIGQYAFYGCKSLETVLLPNTLTTVDTYAFYDCDSLSAITIPDSVTNIGTYCFSNCEKLGNIQFGTGITTIPSYAFDLCPSLTQIVLPYRTERIQANAFTNCTKLTDVTIPRATTSIAANVFSYPAKMTIYGTNGTYAQEYANTNNIQFVNQEINASTVILNKTELKLNRGSSDTLTISVTPDNFTDSVTWKSSDTSIATINENGVVKGVAVGTATIRVNVGNVSADCIVNVVQPVTSVYLDKRTLTLGGNGTFTLTASVGPDNAYDKTLEWSSSDETIASVDSNGTVIGHNKGTAVITAKAADGSERYAFCTVMVTGSGYVAQSVAELESPHNYDNGREDSWLYTVSGAKELSVTFDDRTNVENGFDYLYIYDGKGTEIGKYTGTELAGKEIKVPGDTIKIVLVSDDSGNQWGFKVTQVKDGTTQSENPSEEPTQPDGTYEGIIMTELQKFSYDESTHYLSGQIVVVEWVDTDGDGVMESTVSKYKPKMSFALTSDSSQCIDVFVTPTGTNTYYFDRLLGEGIPEGAEYAFYVTSGDENNIGEYRTNAVYTGNSGIGSEGVLGEITSQNLCFKTSKDGVLVIYGKAVDDSYEGAVNSVLLNVESVKSDYGNFVSGRIVITEWVNGQSIVPATTPVMSFESTDGKEMIDVFMSSIDGTNTYYFDRNLSEDMDVSKEYVFHITLTEPNNVSPLRTMVATTNYMDAKEGILWETDTQVIQYKTKWADNDNQLRVYAVNK